MNKESRIMNHVKEIISSEADGMIHTSYFMTQKPEAIWQ